MRTRSSGITLDPVDPEIEATCRRNNAKRNKRKMATQEEFNQLREQLRILREAQERANIQPAPIQAQFQNVIAHGGIPGPAIEANNFELKTGLISMVQQNQYGGGPLEDPNAHLSQFLDLCATVKINGAPEDAIKIRLFPFSLRDKAKQWFQSIELGGDITWEELAHKFLFKFQPPGLMFKLKMEITHFQQYEGESLYEAWERFKETIRKCPNHGFDLGTRIMIFYNACNGELRRLMDAAAGGALLCKGGDEAIDIIENMASTSYQWPTERNNLRKVAMAENKDPLVALTNQIATLSSKFETMMQTRSNPTVEEIQFEEANWVNNRGFRPQGGYQGGRSNQGGYQGYQAPPSHPNLSYGNPNNALQPPPGFSTSNGVINEQKKPSLEDILMKFMSSADTRISAVETQVKMIEKQVSQIANSLSNQHNPGQFPSNTVVNPKEQCKAITLRSGTAYEGPKMPNKESDVGDPIVEEKEPTSPTKDNQEEKKGKEAPPTSPKGVSMPFPQRHQKKKVDEQFSKFLDIFRKVHINIPLVEALLQMPVHAKFLKDVISKKRRWGDFETVNLNEECSAIIQRKLPVKSKDPGSFTISCVIGGEEFGKALCDLGASINLMPSSIFMKLKIGEIKPTTIALQMADRSIAYARGIVEDVLVKVGDFIFPADFVVLDMEEDRDIPLILGRPFLKTGRALIDVENGELTLRFNDECITFSMCKMMKYFGKDTAITASTEDCKILEVVDLCVGTNLSHSHKDPLEACISNSLFSSRIDLDFNLNCDTNIFDLNLFEYCSALESVQEISRQRTKFLELRKEEDKKPETVEVIPKPELKPLPEHLKYAFLGEDETYPVIVSSFLSTRELDSLLRVLREHKSAIGWSISDLKGISPSLCMHRILMEENVKPRAQNQRRLNPIMQEVVRKEVLKLLDAGIIFAISDSEWVSPTQVVPKKGGMTVVRDESNELIATRLTTGWRVCIDYRLLNAATRKDHFPLPFIDQMLDRLAGFEFYCFLDGYSGYNQIMIAPEDQEKTAFTCPYGIFAYRRMPFGLCNAPATFQRCMMSIFHDLIENVMEVFMDDFSVFGNSFDHCLDNLSLVLQRCEETNLVLNWEKCHFMVRDGIVLGHKVSSAGLEVDRAKIVAIEKLPPPSSEKAVRSFLGHAGFYRRFIKDFSKITKPLCHLLEKDVKFKFDEACLEAFEKLKKALVSAPVLVIPDWSQPFELMCDASDIAVGVALGQKRDKTFRVIYYASRTLDKAQANYTTTEKEMLAVVYAFDKFRSYLIGTKSVVYTDHAAIRYLFDKKDAKPRLLRWILLLQEFDIEIRDRKGCENVVADHLSRLENPVEGEDIRVPINESFPDEQVLQIQSKVPWYADFVNFLAANIPPPPEVSSYQRKKFFHDVKVYMWDEPYLYQRCADKIIRRCVPEEEWEPIIRQCHSSPSGGHFGANRTAFKVLQSGFYWPSIFKDCHTFITHCDRCQRMGGISKKHEMPLTNVIEVELFDVWGIDFMGPFPTSFGHQYILLAVEYVSRWVEAIPTSTNDSKVVLKFLQKHIITRYGAPRALISDGGSHFCNKWLEGLLKRYGVKHRVTSPYHPQANGQTELANREVKQVLEKTVNGSRKIGQSCSTMHCGLTEQPTKPL